MWSVTTTHSFYNREDVVSLWIIIPSFRSVEIMWLHSPYGWRSHLGWSGNVSIQYLLNWSRIGSLVVLPQYPSSGHVTLLRFGGGSRVTEIWEFPGDPHCHRNCFILFLSLPLLHTDSTTENSSNKWSKETVFSCQPLSTGFLVVLCHRSSKPMNIVKTYDFLFFYDFF